MHAITIRLVQEDEACLWRLTIDGYPGGDYPISNGDCIGSLPDDLDVLLDCECGFSLSVFENGHLPIARHEGCPDYFCSRCKCVCQTLCVTVVIDEQVEKREAVWDPAQGGWVDEDGSLIKLSRDEYSGRCVVDAGGHDPVYLDGDTQCETIGFVINLGGGDYISYVCKFCYCRGVIDACDCVDLLPLDLYATITGGDDLCSFYFGLTIPLFYHGNVANGIDCGGHCWGGVSDIIDTDCPQPGNPEKAIVGVSILCRPNDGQGNPFWQVDIGGGDSGTCTCAFIASTVPTPQGFCPDPFSVLAVSDPESEAALACCSDPYDPDFQPTFEVTITE